MRVQVLAIGAIETGINQYTKSPWFRKRFQVFTSDQLAGRISVYGTEQELSSYTKLGFYEAQIACLQGNAGEIEPRFTKLTLVKEN